jgi:phosphohistidine swiveling domain-containing protein
MSQEKQQKMDERWVVPRKRHVPCVWPVHTFWAWPVHEYFGVSGTGTVLSIWERDGYTAIYDRVQTTEILGRAVAERFLAQVDSFEEVRAKGILACEQTVVFARDFSRRAPSAKIDDYIAFFDTFTEKHTVIMKENMHYWVLSISYIEKLIRSELSSYDTHTVDEIFHRMSRPEELSYSAKIESELTRIVHIVQERGLDNARGLITDFSNKYFWFPYEYVGPGIWDETTVTGIIQKRALETVKAESVYDDISHTKEECVRTHGLSNRVVQLFNAITTLALMADDRKRYNSEICYYVNGIIFDHLAKILGIKKEDAYYVDQGLLKVFQKDHSLFTRKLTDRLEMLVEVTEDGKYAWYEGKEACTQLFESLDIHFVVDSAITEFKGNVAYMGKVTGRARVLKTSHVMDFSDGDVLVTGMTTPDFMPVIQKSSAIITNEGGITCHAAIIAREMKKPCIIGTKIATQVLKDGDLVEVDADHGVVRVLERK